jgi:hypothetical protein
MAMACGRIVARKGAYRVVVGKPEGKSPKEGLRVDMRILLKWISTK